MEVNKKFLIETLSALVKVPSLSGNEGEIAGKVSRILEEFGYRPRVDEYHNVTVEVGSGKSILLNSHLDTVPPVGEWSFNPYSGRVAGGRVYGLGASDNKSGVAAMLEIARIFSESEPSGRVVFLFTSREESEKTEAREALVGRVKAEAGVCLDHHIDARRKVAETVVGCKGIGNFEVEVYGKAYHSSEPKKGVNAVYRAAKLIEAIQTLKLPAMKKPLREEAVASITKVNTDGWATMIPDLCKLTINYRALPREGREEAKKRILRFVKRALKKGFKVNLSVYHEGYLIDPSHPVVEAAKKSIKAIGFKFKVAITKGWVDAAAFTNQLRIPTICLGPTTKGQAHVKDEYENVENLVYGTKAVLGAVLNYLNKGT